MAFVAGTGEVAPGGVDLGRALAGEGEISYFDLKKALGAD
jgi:hypothetical protein